MIELRDIHQTYAGPQGPVDALRGIYLQVPAGEVFGIIGRSGAGKSSLVRTIALLNRPSRGSVHVAGRDLTALPDGPELRAARREIGMVFQHFNLLSSRTVYGNVALPLELAGVPKPQIRERVGPLLDLVGLGALAERYPAQISGGQKQRVGIARALANQPKVLLSDEATSALDPETTRSILALLEQINRELGLTVLLITHQMHVIRQVAHQVAVLDAGEIVERGAVLDVFTRPQHATTRSLLEEIVPQVLPESVLARVRAQMRQPGVRLDAALLRLVFSGAVADQPVLSQMVRRFGVDFSVVHGQIDEMQGRPFGTLALVVRGAREQIGMVINQLRAAGILVEELERVHV